MINRCEQLEVVLRLGSINDVEALQDLLAVAEKLDCLSEVEFGSKKLGASDFLSHVVKTGKWSHEIRICKFRLRFGIVTAWNHCFISVAQTDSEKTVDWYAWLSPFLKKKGFVQAWLADCEFDYWQNAEQPIQYELAGRDYSGLPLISNGLPPPLNAKWIDISNNPGRRLIKNGYVEAIGEKMWLSLDFEKKIGGIDAARLRAAGWSVDAKNATGGTILTAPSGSFREGAAIEDQRRLRSALYA